MLNPPTQPITVLGFDFGLKHIGVAIGQSVTHSASPVTTLSAKDGIPNWNEIAQLIETWNPKALIIGIPLHLDGTVQPMTHCARRFMNRLHARFKLPVHAVDERLTSWEAKQRTSVKPSAHKQKRIEQETHAFAAVILIEQWMQIST